MSKIAIPVVIDSRYRIVIPKEIREEVKGLEPGEKWLLEYDLSGEEGKLILVRMQK
jgi:AbrB family looped-hinge helix DNA binding protein